MDIGFLPVARLDNRDVVIDSINRNLDIQATERDHSSDIVGPVGSPSFAGKNADSYDAPDLA
jgi:hypothetical protein